LRNAKMLVAAWPIGAWPLFESSYRQVPYPSAEREPAGFTCWSNIHIPSVLSNSSNPLFWSIGMAHFRLSIKRSQRRCSNSRVYLFGWK
jgi:hypothetical protein